MNCEILETLYIKANGAISCNDDAGEAICLDYVNKSWSPTLFFFSGPITKIRSDFLQGRVPWPGICENCAFLCVNDPVTDRYYERVIRKLQIEPSLACNLRCPACCNQEQKMYAKKPLVMSLERYATALQALSVEGYKVQEIEYCGQGEPVMNPKFLEFIRCARKLYPDAKQRLITNGNADYEKVVGLEKIDQIIVSCDGFFQSNYEKYRVGGDITRVLEFIKKACLEESTDVVWKYILFEFNDSDEELMAAQHAAQDMGVNTLLFVFTHSQFASKKYLKTNYVELPCLYENVTTNFTPIMISRDLYLLGDIREAHCIKQRENGLKITIDEISFVNNNNLNMRGWVLSRNPISMIVLYVNNEFVGNAKIGIRRHDVAKEYPEYKNLNSGFALFSQLDKSKFMEFTIKVVMFDGKIDRRSYEIRL